jgi:hypothetical protein
VTDARADRRELVKMLNALATGDVVTVTRIDRLARSTFDLAAIVKQIVDAEAQFRSLAEPRADTGTNTGRLMLAVKFNHALFWQFEPVEPYTHWGRSNRFNPNSKPLVHNAKIRSALSRLCHSWGLRRKPQIRQIPIEHGLPNMRPKLAIAAGRNFRHQVRRSEPGILMSGQQFSEICPASAHMRHKGRVEEGRISGPP